MAAKPPKRSNKIRRAMPAASARHHRESPLARLIRKKVLSIYEHTAADEIIAAYQMSQGLAVSRDASLGIPSSNPRPDAADDSAARRSDVLAKYHVWRADLLSSGVPAYTAVTSVLFHEESMRQIERTQGWRNGTATGHLLVGLRHFAALRGNVPRDARGWKISMGNKEQAA